MFYAHLHFLHFNLCTFIFHILSLLLDILFLCTILLFQNLELQLSLEKVFFPPSKTYTFLHKKHTKESNVRVFEDNIDIVNLATKHNIY